MRDAFVQTLMERAQDDKDIMLITGDLGFGVLKPFWEQFPDQFINAGIAEQNMTGLAAGMAIEGKTVFTYSIGNFPTLRCVEQIRNDCAYHNANVKIVCVGGGFVYGPLGMSHHATEDISIMRSLPGVSVFAPGDAVEARCVTNAISRHEGTCYLRLGRGGEEPLHDEELIDFRIGQALRIKDGDRVAIFSTGGISDVAAEAVRKLEHDGISTAYLTFPAVKPMDYEAVVYYAKKCDVIVTCEEHSIIGGLGGAVAEIMSENDTRAKLMREGIDDIYTDVVGSQEYLRNANGLNAETISSKVKEFLGV